MSNIQEHQIQPSPFFFHKTLANFDSQCFSLDEKGEKEDKIYGDFSSGHIISSEV